MKELKKMCNRNSAIHVKYLQIDIATVLYVKNCVNRIAYTYAPGCWNDV